MSNRVIWITGASSGIGKALAIKFAKEGWKVAISARRENLLNEIAKTYNDIYPFPLDVTDSEKCKEIFKNILEKFKNIDISVFCTGIRGSAEDKSLNLEKIRKIMEVNFFGTINSINAVYNYYDERKSGQISIVSSIIGNRGLPGSGAYCASKSAITRFTESLYFVMKKKNVKVSIINPGPIKTIMNQKSNYPEILIKSPEFAAEKIFIGLTKKNNFEIHFPRIFTYLMKFIQILPNSIFFGIINFGKKFIERENKQ